jgi:hypothetical protein
MDNDAVFGSLVIGTWINLVLLMIETLQAITCLRQRDKGLSIKYVILWAYMLDMVCSMGNCACVYLYTITHWGDAMFSTNQPWPMSVNCITTGLVALTVQLFLLLRYFSLSRNVWISAVLAILAFASTAAAVSVGILITMYSSYAERKHVMIPSLLWVTATSVTDWGIAGALICELRKMRSRATLRRTDG